MLNRNSVPSEDLQVMKRLRQARKPVDWGVQCLRGRFSGLWVLGLGFAKVDSWEVTQLFYGLGNVWWIREQVF